MMNKDEKETRNNVNEVGKDNSNTANHNFDYIERKPEHSRKALVMLGIALASVLVLVVGGACYVAKNATEAVAQSGLFSTESNEPEEKLFAGAGATDEEIDLESTELAEVLTGDATGDNDTNIVPDDGTGLTVYTEQPIEFELYEVSLSENTLVEPSSEGDYRDGYYLLESDKVYTLQWDAASLFFNDDAKVDAKITANSDYLIKEGGTGTITVTLRDYGADIDYVGELNIASTSGNLGIEFCADACQIRGYGFTPGIDSFNKLFRLCFYTSGEYVKFESNGVSGVVGHYSYEYGVDGSRTEEYSVTKPAKLDDDSKKPTPMPAPDPRPTPQPPKDPDFDDIPPVPDDSNWEKLYDTSDVFYYE